MSEQSDLRVVLGADHAGFELKEEIKRFLEKQGYHPTDLGTNGREAVDYPDLALAVAEGVAKGQFDRGIMVCGTGIGSQVAANKVPGVRASVCHDTYSAKASRLHNDLNVLCLGGRVIGPELALEIVSAWLATEFSGEERHLRRLAKIRQAESTACRRPAAR